MVDKTSVEVAVRVRPLVESEISRGCKDVLEIFPELNQVRVLNSDKAYTYNYVFGFETSQEMCYNKCVTNLLDNLFKGFNVTILAYGQTGSGKTHSMGTSYTGEGEMGIIPRAINDIFHFINDNFAYDFTVHVSFLELYQETLYDLLAHKPRDQCTVEIREDNKCILIPGLTEEVVTTASKTLECLFRGSRGRATASTNMNAQSSRSHAVFTISICMQKKNDSNSNKTAKFHLVDLAGSERSKKTGATGQTFKEGVNINKGLLALGNVISALGDEKLQQGYISYRDSNLTRLLKDSLGGNSITLMIACVSPADYNLEETLSTLRYADRARKIKNKPVVNQDPKLAEINRLNKLVQQLRLELVGQGGPIICQAELESLKKENSTLKIKSRELTLQLSGSLNENISLAERIMIMQAANERLNEKLQELKEEYNITLNNLNLNIEHSDSTGIKEHVNKLQNLQNRLSDIDSEHKKNEEEIRKHEGNVIYSNSNSAIDFVTESEFSERQESHTAKQVALNSELQEVTKMLAMKEHLAQQITANSCHMVDYIAIAENENKILALQKEKEELLQQLKNLQNQVPNSKLAENRRKRVQELEIQIQDLNKKVNEQARLIKLKQKDEQKIKQLNTEIANMKQIKVQLIRNMKQETEKFRTWKIQRERELSKLKDQDRKRQNQIVKMETMYSRQQNVLKRKVEEAAAINKRLKDVLALRKTVQDHKNSGKIERIGPWLQHEFDVFVSTADAEATLAGLLEDRATLHEQLDQLRNDSNLVGSPEIRQLEDDIDLRSAQIQDLQQKILDSDQDSKSKTRFDNIQSMGEAKYALKMLFDLTADIRRKEASNNSKINELEAVQAEIADKSEQQEQKFKAIEAQYAHEISNIQKEYEEKVSVLLRQLRGVEVESVDEELKQRCYIQEQSIEKLEHEIEQLKKNYIEAEQVNKELQEKIEQVNIVSMQCKTPLPLNILKKKGNKKRLNDTYLKLPEDVLDTSAESDDNVEKDPDWRKTPLGKRITKLRATSLAPEPIEDRLSNKRSSEGGCACRGTCSTRNCGCKKLSKKCGHSCKCALISCVNRHESDNDENEEPCNSRTDEETNGDSFKKPRSPLQDDASFKPKLLPKRTKRLF